MLFISLTLLYFSLKLYTVYEKSVSFIYSHVKFYVLDKSYANIEPLFKKCAQRVLKNVHSYINMQNFSKNSY